MTALVFLGLPVLYVTLQWLALRRMRAGWHMAAWLPVYFLALALAVMAIGIASNGTLATLALLVGLPTATAYLLILWPLHLILGRR